MKSAFGRGKIRYRVRLLARGGKKPLEVSKGIQSANGELFAKRRAQQAYEKSDQ